jgi:hypothetical protein
LSGEIAYNFVDGKLYIGFGDDGSGNATSVKACGQDNFAFNLPNGTNGKILGFAGGVPVWQDPPEGEIYTASGNGIELTGTEFSLNYTEIATGISLSTYATTSALTSGLAGKAASSHTHAAADVTSGIFDVARIPDLDAAKVTTGTIDAARLPATVFQAPIVATSNIASLDSGQQAAIRAGSPVVTSDGRSWMYTGSGSKTAEASYREMSDVTPEYSAIANKPSFATVATSGAYSDLSGKPSLATVATSGSYTDLSSKPTLGTIASQAASAVAITGGTIDGVTFDGGTF